jgi:hypothetical protein
MFSDKPYDGPLSDTLLATHLTQATMVMRLRQLLVFVNMGWDCRLSSQGCVDTGSNGRGNTRRATGQPIEPLQLAIVETVVLSASLCWAHLTPDQYRARVAVLADSIEETSALQRSQSPEGTILPSDLDRILFTDSPHEAMEHIILTVGEFGLVWRPKRPLAILGESAVRPRGAGVPAASK